MEGGLCVFLLRGGRGLERGGWEKFRGWFGGGGGGFFLFFCLECCGGGGGEKEGGKGVWGDEVLKNVKKFEKQKIL